MSTEWHKLIINASDENQKEIISAWFMHFGAESVVDQEDHLEVYVGNDEYESLINAINENNIVPIDSWSSEKIVNQNWNAVWESGFNAIDVGDIHIRAEFHPPSKKTEIIIQPKMAFGTGHHNTTYMMIDWMQNHDFSNQSVLDYGCGTGILAVYASMRNAKLIDAIDIQEEAIENTHEHFKLNNLSEDNLNVYQGDLDKLPPRKYDIILANINRHVLLDNALNLKEKLEPNGILVMSGILEEDKELIMETYTKEGLDLKDEDQKGEWCCFRFGLKL
ncbi:MAG: 50S ribosomal protein L11 methyltransferase [Saprospiraceae bacterium]|nr:50S ribosomal protein L11 methyltransferase [Saprospiraceae bacterium]